MHAAGFWRCDPVSPVDQNELSVPSLVDVLHAAIRDRILKGDIEPGASVTEMSIATQYSVARPTAKAAMERLVVDGLLRRSTNKTARVPLLDTEDVRDLYFSRELIERSVVERLATRRPVEGRYGRRRPARAREGPDLDEHCFRAVRPRDARGFVCERGVAPRGPTDQTARRRSPSACRAACAATCRRPDRRRGALGSGPHRGGRCALCVPGSGDPAGGRR